MLQSQFNKLNESGIVLCQLIEKEEYYKSGKRGDFNAASESLLMSWDCDMVEKKIVKCLINSHITDII